MIEPKDMEDAGYREFKINPGTPENHYADRAFQKRVREGEKTLYFLTALYYESGDEASVGWLVQCHLFRIGGESLELRYHSLPYFGIDAMETLFAKVYESLGCVPDIHNN